MIESLIKLIPQSANPVHNPPDISVWNELEKVWNIVFPPDYKDFVNIYGDGKVGNYINILNPHSPLVGLNLNYNAGRILQGYARLQKANPSEYPLPFFPAKDGLFPFATTDDGDTLFWVTSGDSTNWNIAIHYHNAARTQLVPLTFTEFFIFLFNNTQKDKNVVELETVFVDCIEVDRPFISVAEIISHYWMRLREAIKSALQSKEGGYLSRGEAYNLLKSEGFILETILVQDFLKQLNNEKLIELSSIDSKYMKLAKT
jgi:hypothetical protein